MVGQCSAHLGIAQLWDTAGGTAAAVGMPSTFCTLPITRKLGSTVTIQCGVLPSLSRPRAAPEATAVKCGA